MINNDCNIAIYYNRDVDLDGLQVRYNFLDAVKSHGCKSFYSNALEPFAGHGAIGFYLHEIKLCETLTVSDCYKDAVDFCNTTIRENGLTHCKAIQSDCLDNITECFDLVVANIPWASFTPSNIDNVARQHQIRKKVDKDWVIHKKFFAQLSSCVTQDCDIFLWEDSRYSTVDTFEPMFTQSFSVKNIISPFGKYDTGYLIHLRKKDGTLC